MLPVSGEEFSIFVRLLLCFLLIDTMKDYLVLLVVLFVFKKRFRN